MPSYDFRTLSPFDFELLVRDLLSAELGWHLEAFGHGRDGGVDLRGLVENTKVVVQCKHYSGSTFADLNKAARKELPKLDKENPNKYLFVTSQSLSRTQKETLAATLSDWINETTQIFTQIELNELLSRHPSVERQHFKLWLASTGVLERIVLSGVWERSEALLEDISERVRMYVRTPSFERASVRLDDNHVVVLTGAPGVGKSMLAEMLLLTHWHNNWQVISVSSDIDEAWNSFRRNEKQIFYYDDFLGQTDISERETKNEDGRIVRFMNRVTADPTKRLVMTTRSQILRQAVNRREPIARGDFHLRECVLDVTDYGPTERAQILYNHLYFSQIPRRIIQEYVAHGYYWQVVDHPNFSPRILEQVIKRSGRSAAALASDLTTVLDRPIELWGTMFATVLSEVAQRIVLSLISFPVRSAGYEELRLLARLDASLLSTRTRCGR